MVSMYLTSSKMALLTLALLSGFVLCGSIFGAFLRQISYAAQRQGGVASAVAEEAFDNIRTVRAFAMEDEELRLISFVYTFGTIQEISVFDSSDCSQIYRLALCRKSEVIMDETERRRALQFINLLLIVTY